MRSICSSLQGQAPVIHLPTWLYGPMQLGAQGEVLCTCSTLREGAVPPGGGPTPQVGRVAMILRGQPGGRGACGERGGHWVSGLRGGVGRGYTTRVSDKSI